MRTASHTARRRVWARRRRVVVVTLAAAAVLVALLLATSVGGVRATGGMPASIVDGTSFISDTEFFDAHALTEEQIDSFLREKGGRCRVGATCLAQKRADVPATPADDYCRVVPGQRNAGAAWIIAHVAVACGVSPKVLLVMLQKEQGLVTATAPTARQYAHAMGYACPDTPAGCDAAEAGFFRQVYRAARQMQVYPRHPELFPYQPGRAQKIKWAPSKDCGTSTVVIANQATANLYNYTPYRPNIAALAAGHRTGDDCSSYGNRNFYNDYVAWFAHAPAIAWGDAATVPACTQPAASDVVARTEHRVVASSSTLRAAPTDRCGRDLQHVDRGQPVSVTGVYGAWVRVSTATGPRWMPRAALR